MLKLEQVARAIQNEALAMTIVLPDYAAIRLARASVYELRQPGGDIGFSLDRPDWADGWIAAIDSILRESPE